LQIAGLPELRLRRERTVAARAVGRTARRALQGNYIHDAGSTLAAFPRQPALGEGFASPSRGGHKDAGECEVWFARWCHFHSPHLQWGAKVQLTCTHNGHRRRVARALRDLGVSRVLRPRLSDEVLAEGGDRTCGRSSTSRRTSSRVDCGPDGRPAHSSGEMLVECQDSSFKSKEHFLRYAARYVRRPPIAQRRITCIEGRGVRFWTKDKKLRRRVEVQCTPEEFVDRWAQHLPDDYQHAVRTFGLFAPRSLGQTCAAIFAILGQRQRPRPKPRPWADSIKRDFGHNPLLDHKGQQMKWVRRLNRVGRHNR